MERRLNNKGFTLIEIIAAMVLLSIVAFPLVKTFLDGFKFQARGQIRTEANKVIEYVTEQLKNERYGEIGIDEKKDIEEWAKDSEVGSSLEELTITNLPGSKLTSDYTVSIKKISSIEVQKGGLGTPDVYDAEIIIDDSDFDIWPKGLVVEYDDNLLTISGASNDDNNLLIVNDSSNPVNITVKKTITNNVKIFVKGDIKLSQVVDVEFTKEQKAFKQVKLGDKDEIKDEKEYLCEATITAVNNSDDSIKSSMNVTFSVFVQKEENT